jgi:hypothetical protein
MRAAFKPAADFSSTADSSSASSSWPGLTRPSTSSRDPRNKIVDGRTKPDHDELRHNRTPVFVIGDASKRCATSLAQAREKC